MIPLELLIKAFSIHHCDEHSFKIQFMQALEQVMQRDKIFYTPFMDLNLDHFFEELQNLQITLALKKLLRAFILIHKG